MKLNLKINSKNLFIILMICFPISFVVGNLAINLITSLIIFLGLFVFDYKKINKIINYNSLFFLPLIRSLNSTPLIKSFSLINDTTSA